MQGGTFFEAAIYDIIQDLMPLLFFLFGSCRRATVLSGITMSPAGC
jgi:hypothetical protein